MSIVDGLHLEFTDILEFLDKSREISWRSVADENFRKVLLIAAASYFERSMTDAVMAFVEQETARDHPIRWLVQRKAISRQYHTWFAWKKNNANQFFSLFGDSVKDNLKEKVGQDNTLQRSIRAFLEIGRDRNRLVHEDFGNFPLEKTSAEIYELYSDAKIFVEWFPNELNRFTKEIAGGNGKISLG